MVVLRAVPVFHPPGKLPKLDTDPWKLNPLNQREQDTICTLAHWHLRVRADRLDQVDWTLEDYSHAHSTLIIVASIVCTYLIVCLDNVHTVVKRLWRSSGDGKYTRPVSGAEQEKCPMGNMKPPGHELGVLGYWKDCIRWCCRDSSKEI